MTDKYTVLEHYFGHKNFRYGQEELIDGILSGRDVCGVMPTGGGKSICYQVPAMLLDGVTLVISPLISLMQDQVNALTSAGISAAYINSTLPSEQYRDVITRAGQGRYKIIYVAPERLTSESFLSLVRRIPISLAAIDEAHCVSQWGQDFRPSYLRIADFLSTLPIRPVTAAFTATATAEVREDIVRMLKLNDPVCVVTGFDRPNLYFDVYTPDSKLPVLLNLLRERADRSGIVYCSTRSAVEQVHKVLTDNGIPATRYHAGLSEQERAENQSDFQYDRCTVMVATNAFGMGIDKSNVGYVIHYNMPKSIEAYYQEAGRAGRDGEPADCILLFSPGDIQTARFLISNSGGDGLTSEELTLARARDMKRLSAMAAYCKTTRCLRGTILDYFGQPHSPTCGNCGCCKGEYFQKDITISSQMVLSCIVRAKKFLGYYTGKTIIVDILRGSHSKRVLDLGLQNLKTYGIMKGKRAKDIRAIIDALEEQGYVRTNTEFSTLEPCKSASEVLFENKTVTMSVRKDEQNNAEDKKQSVRLSNNEFNIDKSNLYSALRALRSELAKNEAVPAYVIFSNATLADMTKKVPRSMSDFFNVSGVGAYKADKYGKYFLRAIEDYIDGKK